MKSIAYPALAGFKNKNLALVLIKKRLFNEQPLLFL
jgi:hypothetical protein